MHTDHDIQQSLDFKALPLPYFDVKRQQISVVQYILFEDITRKDIIKYLKTQFIGSDNKWYQQF